MFFTNNVLLLCLSSHSTHLLQPLDVRLFGLYQHFYGVAVDNSIRSGQNISGIKKSIFIPSLTEAREATFTPHNIQQSFTSPGISTLNPHHVLGKLVPLAPKRRDTIGIIKQPGSSREIRYKVQAAGKILTNLSQEGNHSSTSVDRVKGIMRSLDHQLEEEIASKELWRELTLKLQNSDKLYNATDRRKLNEAWVLDSAALIELRDARLEKDVKKKKGQETRKCQNGTPVRVRKGILKVRQPPNILSPNLSKLATPIHPTSHTNIITIAPTPYIVVMDSEGVSTDESEPEELSDSDWASVIVLAPAAVSGRHTPNRLSPESLCTSPFHMNLRTRKSHIN